MFRRKITLVVCIFLISALSACNLPSSEPTATEDSANLALTITALAGSPSPQKTATPQFTGTPELTGTPTVPQVTVSQNTNCRTGPGIQYDNIGALVIGQVATVVGKNTSTGYWIINNPGKTGTCWLFPQYATVSGNTANLQEYSIPPTPTPSPTPTFTPTPTLAAPAPVNNVTMDMVCPNASHSGTLHWEDKSNNEDGFNIYGNGVLMASIPANSTSYVVAAAPGGPFPGGIASIFEVEAFNGAGKAAKKSVTKGCP
ncbi:MAG: hypothetical protein HYU84_11050 [Chloroflexi bacterium]|nr:hypothetical protein [Chloroflexota bacterium]MBI3166856.1 hypothetical protein [Chloroflexota bacterium]